MLSTSPSSRIRARPSSQASVAILRPSRRLSASASPAATLIRWDSRGPTPSATNTATWPSPRCSRSVDAACHSRRCAASGRRSAWFAAASTRPAQSAARDASQAKSAARTMRSPATTSAPQISVSAAPAPADRAASASSGLATDHTGGTNGAMRARWKPWKAATTTSAPTGPSGAARCAT